MITITDKSKCSGCHACANACPKNCIQMLSDEEGFWYPSVNKEQCVDCGLCETVCPIIHKWQPDDSRTTSAMAAINHNEDIRLNSSSGGIFTLIAEAIIDQGGVVFGAAFSDDFKLVHHIYVDNKTDLEKLRGSKYVQSKIGDTYKQAKAFLDSGRIVLFTGTPCQIGGLYSYLRKPYDNLYTQDIICHGVPSPMVWNRYLIEREKKANSTTKYVFFRCKKYGWNSYSINIEFNNNKSYCCLRQLDSFMMAFIDSACLRPSCYDCAFKAIRRQSDLTLADFWGIQKIIPKIDDNIGTSLVLVHSIKGRKLIDSIKNKIYCADKEIPLYVVEKYNSAAIASSQPSRFRSEYMSRIVFESPDKLFSEYYPISIKRRIKSFLIKTKIMDFIKKT